MRWDLKKKNSLCTVTLSLDRTGGVCDLRAPFLSLSLHVIIHFLVRECVRQVLVVVSCDKEEVYIF